MLLIQGVEAQVHSPKGCVFESHLSFRLLYWEFGTTVDLLFTIDEIDNCKAIFFSVQHLAWLYLNAHFAINRTG